MSIPSTDLDFGRKKLAYSPGILIDCDNIIEAPGVPAPDGSAGCNMPCTGNAAETCGGAGRINIFNT